jgi:hypothetical protein
VYDTNSEAYALYKENPETNEISEPIKVAHMYTLFEFEKNGQTQQELYKKANVL